MSISEKTSKYWLIYLVALLTMLSACEQPTGSQEAATAQSSGAAGNIELTDQELENLVRRSYQYVAMYNVNNKIAAQQGGYNTVQADTTLKDETFRDIARPNNDTLYIAAMLDLRHEPMILEMPAFGSDYSSLMVTSYDHYVNIPLSTTRGDFRDTQRMLFFTERTSGFDGQPVEGVDHIFEATGDFISAVLRVMPHANEPERFDAIIERMNGVKLLSLSEFLGEGPASGTAATFPPVGATDADVFGTNLLQVMQFVVNHTTFDPGNAEDQALLAALAPLGVAPGQSYDPARVAALDGERVRAIAERVQAEYLALATDPDFEARVIALNFQPKGETSFESVLAMSIIGPIGVPQDQAVYPQISSADGSRLNAMNDYVIRMPADKMPPARAFWSLTLYDYDEGFFIPNEQKKYSVGLNAGMKLDEDGGIEIHIAAEQPEGVPAENWLPIIRRDEDLAIQMRLYAPDLEAFATWQEPVAEAVK